MKTCYCALAAMLLSGLAPVMRAAESPVVFARSGEKVAISIGGRANKENDLVVLTADGQRWGEPTIVKNGTAEFLAPKVRAPMVFCPASLRDSARVIPGELVVYPDPWLPWSTDKRLAKYKETQFVAVGVPGWLDTWFGAVGFPIEKLGGREVLERGNWRMLEKPALIILGRKAAGRGPAEVGRLAIDHRANVLVIEADWLDKSTAPAAQIVVAPKCARGALADLRTQQWPLPPTFRRQTVPWPALWNRLTWLGGEKYPLIEEVYSRQKGAECLRIVFSYLPWQEQLGRREIADELLLRILAETAKGANRRSPLDARCCLLYPAIEKIKTDERPVLAAALRLPTANVGSDAVVSAAPEPWENRGYVLDLRGGSPPPDELFAESGAAKKIETRINKHTPLLILGDNRHLDTWKWLELDRERQKSPRPGVVWLPDSSLPPSLESQLRAMDIFTQWDVFLRDTSREKSYENRENEL
jgi:hypothetical protein